MLKRRSGLFVYACSPLFLVLKTKTRGSGFQHSRCRTLSSLVWSLSSPVQQSHIPQMHMAPGPPVFKGPPVATGVKSTP